MATEFGDLTTALDPGYLFDAEGRGGQVRKYRIPAPSGEVGLWCQQMAQLSVSRKAAGEDNAAVAEAMAALPTPDGHDEDTSFEAVMLTADVCDTLVADGVAHEVIQHAARTVYIAVIAGAEQAIRFAASGGRPEAEGPVVPNRAEKRAAKKAAPKVIDGEVLPPPGGGSSKTTSTAAASTTRRRASGTGTKSPSTRAVKASPGRKS